MVNARTEAALNPQHYRNASARQPIEFIRYMPFSIANAIKYCYRCEQKDGVVQDLMKAMWYLNDYRNTPVQWSTAQLDPRIVNDVLEGVNEFEAAAVRALVGVALCFDNVEFNDKCNAVEKMLRERIEQAEGEA